MKRREFIALLGGAAAWPVAARAQESRRVRKVAVLMVSTENDPQSRGRAIAFEHGLEKLGWEVGRNLQIDYRWGISDDEHARAATADLLKLAPDLILASAPPALRAAQQATRTLPIVFTAISEPVASGFVASLARPGSNTTGFSSLEPTLGAKWLELLKEIAPRITRVAVMRNPASTTFTSQFVRSAEVAAAKLSVEAVESLVHDPAEIDAAMTRLGRERGSGLMVLPDAFLSTHQKRIVDLASRDRLPSIYAFRYFAASGGLISYGPDIAAQFGAAAVYVDRIFRGEKPADLPVQQPTKFELVLNLKTAKALGLTVPDKLLALADEVIE
jgi:putative tryptophan/tyrosine transport system substrate-binding protein